MERVFVVVVLIIFLSRKLTAAHLHPAYHILQRRQRDIVLSPFLSSPLLDPDSQLPNFSQAPGGGF